ncbi:hypothetical protein PsYK624_159820 [Phanerochaete sordida]|uniref:Uncharacterized protein n=1 Tax=Phanerochaete sordida TaxID=48140 RepID=A0A9P3GRA4_9APHY|nr:hypothetical protein PsYK624_159820 [Phanerochaete sordida]
MTQPSYDPRSPATGALELTRAHTSHVSRVRVGRLAIRGRKRAHDVDIVTNPCGVIVSRPSLFGAENVGAFEAKVMKAKL